jgi:hypothetical protein
MANEIESLESLVKKPAKIKKPSNAALWVAYAFFNVTILVFDVIASVTVYGLTQNAGYAIVTFLAGFVPLLMHEFLYLRAYASQYQRYFAIGGAVLAALTVAIVAVLSAAVNVAISTGYTVNNAASELVILTIVVIAALIHTVLAAGYFYLDDGIKANHKAAENIAYHEERMKNLDRAEQILGKASAMRSKKSELANRFGGADGKAALELLLRQFGDDDGDGIPNFLDRVDNRKQTRQFAADDRRPELQDKDFTGGGDR